MRRTFRFDQRALGAETKGVCADWTLAALDLAEGVADRHCSAHQD